MKYNPYSYALSLLCFWVSQNFVKAEVDLYSDDFLLNKSLLSDCSHTEDQLDQLKAGIDFLKLRMEMMQIQMNRQKDVFNSLERKVTSLPQQMQAMQEKLMLDNKFNFEELRDILNTHIQKQIPNVPPPPIDEKHTILSEVKEMLKDHDTMLDSIVINQNNNEKLLKKANCELNTQTLEKTITNKLLLLEKIDEKLTHITSETMKKSEQLNLNKNDIKICYKGENNNLMCTGQSYPTNCAMFDRNYCADNKCLISNSVYGHLKPFMVSCNNQEEGGGWTVIQRRINGSVDFYRNWSEYKKGFGNIDGEFFIGLDKLHALTATLKPVELLIQLEDFDNTWKYAKFDDFQVGNEAEKYKLINIGSYEGNAGDSLTYHVGNYFSTKDKDNDKDSNSCAQYKTGAWWYDDCGQSNLNGKYYDDPNELRDAPVDKRGAYWYTFHGFQYSLKSVRMMIRPRDF